MKIERRHRRSKKDRLPVYLRVPIPCSLLQGSVAFTVFGLFSAPIRQSIFCASSAKEGSCFLLSSVEILVCFLRYKSNPKRGLRAYLRKSSR